MDFIKYLDLHNKYWKERKDLIKLFKDWNYGIKV